jgi:hypothetical protein
VTIDFIKFVGYQHQKDLSFRISPSRSTILAGIPAIIDLFIATPIKIDLAPAHEIQ